MAAAPSHALRPGRVAAVLAAVAVALGLLALAHLYLAKRLVLDPGLAEPWRSAALAFLAVAALSLVALPVLERRVGRPWLPRLVAPPLLWMGILWLLLVALLASDALVWILGAAGGSPRGLAALRAVGVCALVAAAVAVGTRGILRPPAVRRVEVPLARWPAALDGLRLVQISDVHIGPLLGRDFSTALAERVHALAPDLVAVTGDLADGPAAHLADEVAPLGALHAPLGVYFVTGNHDYYSGDAAWVARVRELGWQPLRNARVALERAGAVFDLAGVDDHRGDWVRGSAEDLPRALAGRDRERPVVLLAHDPSTFRKAARAGVDLQLSGHTHGGQIWPFRWLVRLAVPFVAGLYRVGESTLYVSRGTGFWGPPLRLGAPGEITEIVLRSS